MPLRFWRKRLAAVRASGSARSGTLSRVLENALYLLAGKGVGAVLSLVYLGIATRTLGLEGFGQFSLILAVAQSVSALVGFQTWQIAVRYGVAPLAAGDQGRLGRLLGFCLALDVGGAIVGCAIAAGGILLLGGYFGWPENLRVEALFFCVVVLLAIRSTPVGILRLYDRFGLAATADAVLPMTRLVGALAVLAAGPSVSGFLYAWAASELVTAAAYWWFALRTARPALSLSNWRHVGEVPGENDGIVGFATVTNLNTTFTVIGKQFTTIIVGLFVGPAAAGSYRLAFQLSQALAKLTEALSRSVFAELSRVHFGGASGSLERLSSSVGKLALVAGLLVVALLVVAGEAALRLIAGPDFVGAYPLLVLLGAAAAIDLGSVGFEPSLLVAGRARQTLVLRFVSSLILLGLMFALLPRLGAIGAGVAMLIGSAVGFLLLWFAARRAIAATASQA